MTIRRELRICPLCEATCGLELELNGREVQSVRGDRADPFSEGFLCPKGEALKDLHDDPDRLRQPMIRSANGWRNAEWDEAFEEIDRRLTQIISDHGNDAVGLYLGNPVVHNTALTLYVPLLRQTLRTKNVFTASSVDQIPKQLAVGLMFGNGLSVPVPDIDRSQYLLFIGSNPIVSNGSLMTAPNIGERLKRLRRRGGKVVVIDPCRTRTARVADEHIFIRPGTDALFLFAIVHTLFEEGLTSPGRLGPLTIGIGELRSLADPFAPEIISNRCGIPAKTIRRIARELASAPSAAIHGRMGTCTQRFGTLSSWLPEAIHILTGNLDREGGAMFTNPAHGPANTKGRPGTGRGLRLGRWKSRVRGLPEIFGELPVACLAEEIETPGDGQILAMLSIAGNPILSTPDGTRLSRAFESLEFMISMDIYLNETSRHADVILPGISPLENSHYDIVFSQLAVHNHARYSPALFEIPDDQRSEWETLLRLVGVLSGMGPHVETSAIDDQFIGELIKREVKGEGSIVKDRDPGEILEALGRRGGPDRIIDLMLRSGPNGDGFGTRAEGLTLQRLEDESHGVDLGPLRPRIPEILRTSSGKIELIPDEIVEDVPRLLASLTEIDGDSGGSVEMLLIGRRDIRSNNSWMHNIDNLVDAKRCTMRIHPKDARRLDLENSGRARVSSRTGTIEVTVEVTEDISPGVVSIPHGWGHQGTGLRLARASANAGVNSNLLADASVLDGPSGNAVLCGIPIAIEPLNHSNPVDSRKSNDPRN